MLHRKTSFLRPVVHCFDGLEASILTFFFLLIVSHFATLPLFSQTVDGVVFSPSEAGVEGQFWEGVEFFRSGHYQQAAECLSQVVEFWRRNEGKRDSLADSPLAVAGNLYSLSLMRAGHQDEGYLSFGECYRQGMLDGEGVLNYGLVALRRGELELALQLAGEAAVFHSGEGWLGRCKYVAALAAFGLEDWIQAEHLFGESRNLDGAAFRENPYHQYYLALSQFRQNKWSSAYQTFQNLYHSTPLHPVANNGARLAIHCALQLYQDSKDSGEAVIWWSHGAALAQELVDAAQNQRQAQEAVLLAARIYSDGGRHQQAISLLEPYLGGQDQLALSCRFLAAEILAAWGQSESSREKLEQAAREYGRLGEICSPSQSDPDVPTVSQEGADLGSRASYRQGEIFYSLGCYGEAAQAFSFYRHNYPAGSYSDAALYFNGDALSRDGFPDQAILLHETLLSRHPHSSFAFSSMVALMDLYEKKGEYGLAQRQASQLQERFPQQARVMELESRLESLSLLSQGAEFGTVELLRQYKAAGEWATAEGRRLGVDLAARYLSSGRQVHEAERILLQLLDSLGVAADGIDGGSDGELSALWEPSSVFAGEEAVAAQGSYLLADLYRQQERYGEAARLFLVSARLFLVAGGEDTGDGEKAGESAAAALYRGAESFDVAGMGADCRAVARQLESLFPQSRWTEAARVFL